MARKTPSEAPALPVEDALRLLYRRHVRAAVALGGRLIAVAVLMAVLEARVPALRERTAWVTLAAAALVVWPFYTATGRIVGWRIALGGAYLRERRWQDAERLLGVLLHRRWQPFDAQGEGMYGLAVALREQGRPEESARVLSELVRTRRGSWRERAQSDLAAPANPGSPNPSANS